MTAAGAENRGKYLKTRSKKVGGRSEKIAEEDNVAEMVCSDDDCAKPVDDDHDELLLQ